jgi:hypothetical protein
LRFERAGEAVKSLATPGAVQDDGVTTVSPDARQESAVLPWPYGELPQTIVPSSSKVRSVRSVRSQDLSNKRPVQAADVAQARLFDAILRSEIDELEELAETAERRWLRHRRRGVGDDTMPESLIRLGERVAEAHRLLTTLRERFPHE